MAKITRLASTLIARYYPSKTLTDAFYMDGRLFGKREIRNADITIDKEERGFFFSVFSHPTIPGYEPGMVPPYEPQLRAICNEVKFGRKPIDEMISGFLTSAVDITGKMKLQDQDNRAPYFSGVIVHDSEAFAVTIGSGLAFLYRNDAIYPLTDAGIPMEPIDAFGNRVGDFYNYVSSKTANALWSNITTLSVDDCIILCNKAVYDALGQRELLRILDEAEDQCDAAGTVITQAAANMPNVPMQFSISFVESVTADEKKGFFSKFGKKNKEEDMENMSIKSTFEGGIIGAAAGAVANAGFATGVDASDVTNAVETQAAVDFGDTAIASSAAAVATSTPEINLDIPGASKKIEDADVIADFVMPKEEPVTPVKDIGVEFLDSSVSSTPTEVSPEEMMKTLFGEMEASKNEALGLQKKAEDDAEAISPFVIEEPTPSASIITEGTAFAPQTSEIPSDSPFVSTFNPFAAATPEPEEMETIEEIHLEPEEDNGMMDTKTASTFDSLFVQQVQNESGIASNGIIAAALREMQAESAMNAETEADDSKEEVPETEKTVEEAPAVSEVVASETLEVVSNSAVVEEAVEEVAETVDEVVEETNESVISFGESLTEEAKITEAVFDPSEKNEDTIQEEIPVPSFTIDEKPATTIDPVSVNNDEITFGAGNNTIEFGDSNKTSAPFNPYEIGSSEEFDSMQPVVFPTEADGDFDQNVVPVEEPEVGEDVPSFEWKEEGSPTEQIESELPVPKYDINPDEQTVNPVENVSFPVSKAPNAEPAPKVTVEETPEETAYETENGGYVLPFENAVYTEPEPEVNNQVSDIPDMPLYGSQTYDAPTYAVNSEQPIDDASSQAYAVGGYVENEDVVNPAPYQTYGSETIDDGMMEGESANGYDNPYEIQPGYEQQYAQQGYEQTGYDQQYAQQTYDGQYAQPGYDQQYAQQTYDGQYAQPGYEQTGYDQQYAQQAYDGQYAQPGYEQTGYEQQYAQQAYEQASNDPSVASNQYSDNVYDPNTQTGYPVDDGAPDLVPADDEWVNSILGLGVDGNEPAPMNYIDPNVNMAKGPVKTQARPGTKQPAKQGQKRPTTQSGRPGTPSRKKKKFKLSRNGMIFLAFVAILLIALIVIISLIVKSCSSDETKIKDPNATAETKVEDVVETTPAPVVEAKPDPTAPVGVFVFSDYTGYRTWYDLFAKAYGIQIENLNDTRIATICNYNGAAEGYVPASGDTLLLPPIGVLNGSVPTEGGEGEVAAPAETEPAETTGTIEGAPSIAE